MKAANAQNDLCDNDVPTIAENYKNLAEYHKPILERIAGRIL